MVHSISIAIPVWDDVQQAVDWYEEQQPKLGQRFWNEFDVTVQRIAQYPYSHAYTPGSTVIRKARVKDFPYAAFYFMKGSTVRIFFVMELHRHPRHIARRYREDS